MKFNILLKTLVTTLSSLFVMLVLIGWYNFNIQSNIINSMQNTQKAYIIKQLNDIEKDKIETTKDILDKLSQALQVSLSTALYNIDEETIRNNILKFLLKNESAVSVLLFDNMSKSINTVGIKYNGDVEFLTSLPKDIEKLNSLKYDMIFEDENIGYVKMYYDTSDIVNKIAQIKKENLILFEKEAQKVKEKASNEFKQQIMILIISGIIFAFIILIIIKVVVIKPLAEFQKGLNSFFDYLKKPSNKVNKINIPTSDEFGQMANSVNDSIKVSIQMHGEMAQLMMAMDKNVITSETDEKGIITHVSKAFCDISGYTKEELIGQPHNMVRHPDMPKEVFKEIWETIQSGKQWEGEVKNIRRDKSFYWVHVVISPKCTKAGGSCGYTAIRYDITDKKEVEDLTANLEIKIEERTLDLEESKKEVEAIHKHTRESIEYASLIQGALIPQKGAMEPFFKDHFVTWTPKDTVGGDIWLFNQMRHEDECLLFFIDCTGHGVPGAFVTMIVKAIEREIVSKINKHPEFEISPAVIMGYFNRTMKQLLRQETKDSLSNAGWDGGVIYYNRRTQILKFAGAETPLFYIDANGEFQTVKGNRYSVGYKKCSMDYEYKETIIEVEEGMKFFCTTDGYLDQNGGAKDFPFGKKRFGNIIKENHTESMADIQSVLQYEMMEYESAIPNNDRNDDMTVIGFEIGAESFFFEMEIEEIVKYEGVMTQNVIASCMDNIEVKITNMGMMGIVSTITIEYCQNMMNYSKNEEPGNRDIVPAGTIEVQYIDNQYYDIVATNIVSVDDKEKIEPKLIEIQGLDKAGIKKRYRELRKSGKNTHEKGGGIGMYEIAKVSDSIEYHFTKINDDKYSFTMKSVVTPKVREK